MPLKPQKIGCLRRYASSNDSSNTLVCFPHAGGAASAFTPFMQEMTKFWSVLVVQYPGRECRYTDPSYTNLLDYAKEIACALKPYDASTLTFFGHSMGAKIAFEVASMLPARPELLITSCSPAPDSPPQRENFNDYSDQSLKNYLRALGGTVSKLLDNDDLMGLVLPIIRNDFKALDRYSREVSHKHIETPICALFGDSDQSVQHHHAAAWENWTNHAFSLNEVSGDHFYFQKLPPEQFVSRIRQAHSATLGAVA